MVGSGLDPSQGWQDFGGGKSWVVTLSSATYIKPGVQHATAFGMLQILRAEH